MKRQDDARGIGLAKQGKAGQLSICVAGLLSALVIMPTGLVLGEGEGDGAAGKSASSQESSKEWSVYLWIGKLKEEEVRKAGLPLPGSEETSASKVVESGDVTTVLRRLQEVGKEEAVFEALTVRQGEVREWDNTRQQEVRLPVSNPPNGDGIGTSQLRMGLSGNVSISSLEEESVVMLRTETVCRGVDRRTGSTRQAQPRKRSVDASREISPAGGLVVVGAKTPESRRYTNKIPVLGRLPWFGDWFERESVVTWNEYYVIIAVPEGDRC